MEKEKIYLALTMLIIAGFVSLGLVVAMRGLYRFQDSLSNEADSFTLPDLEAEVISCSIFFEKGSNFNGANMIATIQTINNGAKPSFEGIASGLRILSPIKGFQTFFVPPLGIGEESITGVSFYLDNDEIGGTLKPVVLTDINEQIKESNEENNKNEQTTIECEKSYISDEIQPKVKAIEDSRLRLE